MSLLTTDPIRRLGFVLLAGLALALPARATTYSVDYTDLWWNSPDGSESGWGVNVVQQSDTLFLTFFVYGANNAALWVVAPAMTPVTPQPAGAVRFSGELYQTTGPWFGAPSFNPSAVGRTVVGTATVNFDSPDSGTLSYSVAGAQVVKTIKRQGFRPNSFTGTYIGGMFAVGTSCNPSSYNGTSNLLGTVTASQSATQLTLRVDFLFDTNRNGSCTFAGNYAQSGRLATVTQGVFSCQPLTDFPNAGTFTLAALEVQRNGFHAAFSGADQFCTYNGRFGGTRDTSN